jgi:hypothetical protein
MANETEPRYQVIVEELITGIERNYRFHILDTWEGEICLDGPCAYPTEEKAEIAGKKEARRLNKRCYCPTPGQGQGCAPQDGG